MDRPSIVNLRLCSLLGLALVLTAFASTAHATCRTACKLDVVDADCNDNEEWVVEGALWVTAACAGHCSGLGGPGYEVPVDEPPLVGLYGPDGVLVGSFERKGMCDGVARFRWTGSPLCNGIHRIETYAGGYEVVISNPDASCVPERVPNLRAIVSALRNGVDAGAIQ